MPRDPNTCANHNEVTIEHMELDWFIDFLKTQITGTCILHYSVLKDCKEIILDISGQKIHEVKLNDVPCKYKTGEMQSVGQYILLEGEFRKGQKGTIQCRYSTVDATALQFVQPELTADKTHPFLYSQCQSTHARSIVPCMDTPSVKQSYKAKVNVPEGMQCLMSAVLQENEGQNENKERVEYSFVQKVPIPSYLLAIVVGALVKRDISPRCAVWAESSMADRAHWEFEETEKMLTIATELMGEFRWGRFDMVVLPPFFPFGGMENPCMTFVTPTIIAGDRSLTPVVAHEIAHSWTGNLVTNANWEHFWLNEGFTKFMENKILGRMFGEQFRLFLHLTGWEDNLRICVFETFHPEHPFTKLVFSLDGECVDDAFSQIPYQKGAALLLLLEQRLGDNARFEQFLRDYVVKFAYRSIVTDEWLKFLYEYFADKKAELDSIEWEKWLHQPGMPPQKPKFDDTLLIGCQLLASTWLYGTDEAVEALNADQFQEMMTEQKEKIMTLLDIGLAEGKKHLLDHKRLELMEKKYSLNGTCNTDVLCKWILLAIQARWSPIIPLALKFVTDYGRMKYVRPCYQRLFGWEESRKMALDRFEGNKPTMHHVTIQCVNSLLKNKNKKANGKEEKGNEEVCKKTTASGGMNDEIEKRAA